MAASYSQISLYERCAFAYHCRYKQKIKEPESEALKRGIKVHNKIEDYIKGKRKTLKDVSRAKKFIDEIKKMDAKTEEFWHFNKNWEMVDDWNWLVVKVDAYCIPKEGILRLIDWKTGKPWPEHRSQLHLYATAGFSAYDCHTVECIASYVDAGSSIFYIFEEDEYESMKDTWSKRISRLEKEKKWKMNPGFHCKWCNFGKSKEGPCSYG